MHTNFHKEHKNQTKKTKDGPQRQQTLKQSKLENRHVEQKLKQTKKGNKKLTNPAASGCGRTQL